MLDREEHKSDMVPDLLELRVKVSVGKQEEGVALIWNVV